MTLSEGTILKSRYKIIKKIGGGGYGQVYLAEDTLKESFWAVKEMDVEDLSDKDRAEIREQFWFEAKILVKLSHPQLPKIEDFFEDNGKYYIVMEYIKGKDLFDIIKLSSNPFPVEEVTGWVIKICNVLEYLHNQKPHAVIFRDLKPENVMLSDDGEIKLIDFGISKLFDVNRHTRNYAKAASPYFSSPEQYGGKTTDKRSDIFSLGATMYYIYTGNFPVDAIERAINEIPMTVPGNLNSQIPKKLDNVILKAMELNKENRYQTVEELTGDLLDCITLSEKVKEPGKICTKCHRENPSMSRFCGRCGIALTDMTEEPKVTTDLEEKIKSLPKQNIDVEEKIKSLPKQNIDVEEKIKSVPEKNIVYSSQFIFIYGSDEKPLSILKKPRQSAEEYNEQLITGPAIISRYHYSVKSSGKDLFLEEKNNHIIPLKQFFITPDKKIYMSCKEIKLFSFSPSLSGEKLKIILQGRDNKEIFYEDIMELDEEGISYKILPPHKEGDYILKIIEKEATLLEEIILHIYEKLPPSLDIEIKYYRLDKNIEEGSSITIDLYISKDGIPFSGLLKLLLLCNNRLISSLRPDIEEGRFSFKFNTGNDRGPFILKGEGAGTFQLFLPEREEKHINIGNSFEIALKNLPARTDRGLFYKKLENTGQIVEFQELESETGKIKVLDDLDVMQIAVINPVNGESKIYDFNNISKNSLLEFQSYSPYSLVHIGTWKNHPHETFGIIISPLKFSASMDVQEKAVPGEEVEVIIETEEIAHCLLMVTDVEIPNPPLLRKLTYDLYNNIKKNTELTSLSEQFNKGDDIDKYHLEPLITDREGEIIHVELVDKIAKKVIKMPDKPGLWHIYSYILKDLTYMQLHRKLIVEEHIFIEFDLPKMMNRGDKITGKIYFSSPKEANLLISTPDDYFEGTVSGTGSTDFEVAIPGEITGDLSFGDKHWKITNSISPGAIENITFSEISLLQKGEVIEGQNLTLYPGHQFLIESINSIQNFSLESSEVLSSKLAAMAIKYKLLSHIDMTGDLKELGIEINNKLNLLNIYIKNGLFSLWEESKPSIDVSIKIMSNMKVFLTIPFPLAHRLIETCTEVLLNKGIRKYSLSSLNARFMPLSGKTENPILTYLYGPPAIKGQMAELIKILALKDGDSYYWKGEDFWGGNMEATCYAIKAMYLCKEEDFFNKGLKFILKNLKNGTLNSTSDTLPFIELLWEINLNGSYTCLVNGEVTTDKVIVHGKIEALENRLIVKKDRVEKINHMEKTKKLSLSIEVIPDKAIIGEVISIIIKPKIKTICPVVKIFLPGNMDLLEITPGIQFVTLPIKMDSLEIKALAVRKGKGKINVIIEDFYKPEYSGYGESVDIITGEG
jgi:serine/threonine protein kinase